MKPALCFAPYVLFVLAFSTADCPAQVRLTDVVVFGADSAGSWRFQPNVWETRPGLHFNNWIQSGPSGGPFLNGPNDAQVRPDIVLDLGIHSFRILAAPGVNHPYFGINLFFDQAESPSISAFGPMLTR